MAIKKVNPPVWREGIVVLPRNELGYVPTRRVIDLADRAAYVADQFIIGMIRSARRG